MPLSNETADFDQTLTTPLNVAGSGAGLATLVPLSPSLASLIAPSLPPSNPSAMLNGGDASEVARITGDTLASVALDPSVDRLSLRDINKLSVMALREVASSPKRKDREVVRVVELLAKNNLEPVKEKSKVNSVLEEAMAVAFLRAEKARKVRFDVDVKPEEREP